MWLCLKNVFRVPKVVIFFNALCNFKGHQLPLLIIHSLKNYLWEAIFYWGSFSHAQINQLYSKPVILCFNILDHRSPPNWKRDAALIMCHKIRFVWHYLQAFPCHYPALENQSGVSCDMRSFMPGCLSLLLL